MLVDDLYLRSQLYHSLTKTKKLQDLRKEIRLKVEDPLLTAITVRLKIWIQYRLYDK